MNIYTIIGNSQYLGSQKIKEILKAHQLTMEDVTPYDMQEVPVQEALFDVSTPAFLAEKKAVLMKNAAFLTAERAGKIEHDVEELTRYVKSPNPDNVLIIHAPYEKIDGRKGITKLLKKQTNYTELMVTKDADLASFTRGELSALGISTTPDVISFLVATARTWEKLSSEIQKISDYFADVVDEKKLTMSLARNLAPARLEDNVFLLTEHIINGQAANAYTVFEDLMVRKEEPIKLLVMIANQFRLLYQVGVLADARLSERDMVGLLGVHPYRVTLARRFLHHFPTSKSRSILQELADIDVRVKAGKIPGELALSMFILGNVVW